MVLRELLARFDLKFNDRGFNKADKAIGATLGKVKNLAVAVGGIFAVRKAISFIDDVREVGDEIDKTSIALGVSRKALQEWRFAAGIGGVKATELNMAMRTVQKAALDAADGAAEYKDEFDRLGITVTDTNGKLKSADVLMMEMADGLQQLESDTAKVATASNLMGRSGARLLPLFKDGSAGVAKMRAELESLGGLMDDKTVDSMVELTDDIHRLDTAMLGVRITVAKFFVPAFIDIVNMARRAGKALNEFIKGTKAVESALLILGTAAVVMGAKLLLPFLPAILAMGALWLVVDELLTLFDGGDTVIGRFVDAIYGPGSAEEAVNLLKEAGEGMVLWWKQEYVPTMEEVGAAFFDLSASFQAEMGAMQKAFNLFVDDWTSLWSGVIAGIEKMDGVTAGLNERLSTLWELYKKFTGVGLLKSMVTFPKDIYDAVTGANRDETERGVDTESEGDRRQQALARSLRNRRRRLEAGRQGVGAGLEQPAPRPISGRRARAAAGHRAAQHLAGPIVGAFRVGPQAVQGPMTSARGPAVNQEIRNEVNVNVATGASPRQIGREVGGAIKRVSQDQPREIVKALKQGA